MVRAKVAHVKSLTMVAASAALAACAQEPPQVPLAPPPPMIAGQCDAQAAQFAVGKLANQPLAEEARIKANAQRMRMVRPGEMVTMEFDAARLTIDVDESGKVSAVRCG